MEFETFLFFMIGGMDRRTRADAENRHGSKQR